MNTENTEISIELLVKKIKFKQKANQRPSNNHDTAEEEKEFALIGKNHKVLIISEEKE